MAKDYFEDIVPPENAQKPIAETAPAERSIRNVVVSNRVADRRDPAPSRVAGGILPSQKKFSSFWLWGIASLGVVVLGALILLSFQSTTVTVTPRSHTVAFDASSTFSAYPAASASTGTLTYTVSTFDLTESEVIKAEGSKHVDHKASGSITIVNEFSTAPVKLIKNTRFSSPAGLIFRTPADVVVPGMKSASSPGKVTVTVIADQAGSSYNIGPTTRFKVPGLVSKADMYAHVYAKSDSAMTGGSSGTEPGVAQADLDAALAKINARLQQSAMNKVAELTSSSTLSSMLSVIEYENLPTTPEQSSQVRVGRKAHVSVPIVNSDELAHAIAKTVSADADTSTISMVPLEHYGASPANDRAVSLGTEPLTFTLLGTANLIWTVDGKAVAQALAGKTQGAFQGIVDGFSSIQEARARIQPFWNTSFPTDPNRIHVEVVDVLHHAKS